MRIFNLILLPILLVGLIGCPQEEPCNYTLLMNGDGDVISSSCSDDDDSDWEITPSPCEEPCGDDDDSSATIPWPGDDDSAEN